MKIILTNIDISNILSYTNSENSIANNTTTKFTMEFCWKFTKNIKKLSELNESFLNLQQELISNYISDDYSFTSETGERILKPEFVDEYNQKLDELVSQENEIDIDKVRLDKVVIGGMDGLDKIELSVPELEVLSFMIDEPIIETK